MVDWIEASADASGTWLYLLALPVAIPMAIFCYCRTEPLARSWARIALWTLRTATVCLVTALLVDPVLILSQKRAALPRLLVIVDTSLSMSMHLANGSTRFEQAADVASADFSWLRGRPNVEMWGFAETPYRLALDSLSSIMVGGRATNISRALGTSVDEAETPAVAAILLLSDGRHNLGHDPVDTAVELGVPITICAVGDTRPFRDVAVEPVHHAGPVFAGETFELGARVSVSGATNSESIELTLSEDGAVLSTKELFFNSTSGGDRRSSYPISFTVGATTPGPHIYRIAASALSQEAVLDNNETLLFVTALRERIIVHLAATTPGFDYSFLRRALAADSTLIVYDRVPSVWSRSEPLNLESDVLVLVDPDSDLIAEIGERALEKVHDGGGLLFIGGPQSARAVQQSPAIRNMLPFEDFGLGRYVASATRLSLTAAGQNHPVTRAPWRHGSPITTAWRSLPPLSGYLQGLKLRAQGRALIAGRGVANGQEASIVAIGTYGRGRVMAIATSRFWELAFHEAVEKGPAAGLVWELWQGGVKWLAAAATSGRVRSSTSQFAYRTGEEVFIVADISDDLLRPEADADAFVTLLRDGRALPGTSRLLKSGEPGRYTLPLRGLSPGSYAYTVEATQAGRALGAAHQGRFEVVEQTVESSDMRPDFAMLEEIARASGGRFLKSGSCGAAKAELDMEPILVHEERTVAMWGDIWPLSLLILLLGGEWLIRKRVGML